jgi:hypothetical protein
VSSSLLDRFEDQVNTLVQGAFAKAFPSEVQPVEIAAALQSEMEENALTLAGGTVVAPNDFLIEVSSHDAKRLMTHIEALRINLVDFAGITARQNDWTLLDKVHVQIDEDPDLDLGVFRVTANRSTGAKASEPLPSYRVQNPPNLIINGTSYPLEMSIVVIGRGADADLRVNDPAVSRRHLRISYSEAATFEDLETRNGTVLNGESVTSGELKDGDKLMIGSTTIIYRESDISE